VRRIEVGGGQPFVDVPIGIVDQKGVVWQFAAQGEFAGGINQKILMWRRLPQLSLFQPLSPSPVVATGTDPERGAMVFASVGVILAVWRGLVRGVRLLCRDRPAATATWICRSRERPDLDSNTTGLSCRRPGLAEHFGAEPRSQVEVAVARIPSL
jgi:hypothetical protein